MEIQRQSDYYGLDRPEIHHAQLTASEISAMTAGPQITPGMLNPRTAKHDRTAYYDEGYDDGGDDGGTTNDYEGYGEEGDPRYRDHPDSWTHQPTQKDYDEWDAKHPELVQEERRRREGSNEGAGGWESVVDNLERGPYVQQFDPEALQPLDPSRIVQSFYRQSVSTEGMDPESHAYHTELPYGPGEGREYNPDFREYEPSDDDERRQEAVGEDDDSGYNWGPDSDYQDVPCDACGAEAGEPCRVHCIGQAAHEDSYHQDGPAQGTLPGSVAEAWRLQQADPESRFFQGDLQQPVTPIGPDAATAFSQFGDGVKGLVNNVAGMGAMTGQEETPAFNPGPMAP
jgi:hypothetical protein